jgi:hypothetical protein
LDNQSSSGGGSGNGGGGNSGPTIDLDAKAPTPSTPVDQGAAPEACANPTACTDFPSAPIIDSGAPSNAPSQFSGNPSGTGPCVTEPEDGSLFPYNWLRPRIKWTGSSGLMQITMHADIEANDLVAYTTSDHWIVPKDVWTGLSKHVHESDITVSVRAAGGGATTVKFQIASASAAGNIVFWAADATVVNNQNVEAVTNSSSMLKGFSVGEDSTIDALLLTQVKQPSMKQSFDQRSPPTCMGCHAATPDHGFVAFVDHWPWSSVIAGVTKDNVGDALPNLSGGGLAALNKPWAGPATFSGQFWQPNNRIMVTISSQQVENTPWGTDNKQPAKLVWYNLDSPAPTTSKVNGGYIATAGQQYGVIARNGDSNGVAFPAWSHDGSTIVYSSTNGGCQDGRLAQGATDLYSVPYNGGNGGDAKPLPGASEKSWEEYYAAYSSDDQLVVFDRIPAGGTMYANPNAEIFFVPVGGASGAGKAIRLDANDPVACTGKTSPGINNHFPRWAPATASWQGRTYYWVIFSSNRVGLPKQTSSYDNSTHEISQLFLSAVTLENGQYKTYRSIYLWNQPTDTVNTTPVWDIINIPPARVIY